MIRAIATLLILLTATSAAAQFYDSRSMGLGGGPLRDGRGTLRHANPAYTAVPVADDPRAGWALPLGLLQALGDLPEFDPADADFDASRILQWQLQPPGPLAIGRQAPLSEDASLEAFGGAFSLTGAEKLPSAGVHRADVYPVGEWINTLNLGRRYGVLAMGVDGFVHHAVDADHEAVTGGRETFRGWGILQTGFALEASYAREIRLKGTGGAGEDWLDAYWDEEDARPRLYVGGAARRMVGVGLTHLEGIATVQRPDVEFDTVYTSALAGFDGGAALGWAFDVGAVLRWGRLEVGAAAADLGASLDWPDVRRERVFTSADDQGVAQQKLAEGVRYETRLPRRTLLNLRWRRPEATWVLDGEGIGNRKQGHLGCEVRRGAWIWRGGAGVDTRGRLQGGAGAGWRQRAWTVDLGLLTDSGNLDGSRALTLGLSVGWIR